MNLELTEEQEEFRATARRFLDSTVPLERVRELFEFHDGFDRDWWERSAGLGWSALLAPAAVGGGSLSGRPTCDAVIVAEEIGRSVAPGPFTPISLSVAALASDPSTTHERLLSGLVAGTTIATWAHAEARDEWDPERTSTKLVPEADHVVVSGHKCYVEAAEVAEVAVVTARLDGELAQVVVPLDATGVKVVPGRSIDMTRRFGSIVFEGVRVARDQIIGPPGATEQVTRQLRLARALQCAQMNGAAASVIESTVRYAKDRYAFGRPIGSFQALKHRFADMLQRLEFAHAVADGLAEAIDGDGSADEVTRLSLVAKIYVAEAALDIVDDCVQINGGIGVTWEHDIHMFSRRIALERALYGGPESARQDLADLIGVAVA